MPVNRRWLLTPNYEIRVRRDASLTRFEPIFNDIVARKTCKRVRHGEDGEEQENKCEGFGHLEVHVCVIETESWCVGLFNLKLALFIASIESEMSAIRKQPIGTILPVKQFITDIWLITTSHMFFYWMAAGVVTVTLNFRSSRQSNSCLLAVLEHRYRDSVVRAVLSGTAISTSPGCDTVVPMTYGTGIGSSSSYHVSSRRYLSS